jgi:hypothetical protein
MALNQTVRIVLDIAMTILLLCAYAYRITGDTAHEWIGVSTFILFVAHNIINRRWYKNIFTGKYIFRRIIMTAVNIMLATLIVVLIITGLLHSRKVLAFLHLPGSMELRLIHTTAAYWLLPLIGLHIGLHWGMIINTFHKNGENRTRKIIARVLAFVFVIFGVWSSFDRDMFSKLFQGFSFYYWDMGRPMILFFACMLSIIGIYVFITYYTLKFIGKFKKQNKS